MSWETFVLTPHFGEIYGLLADFVNDVHVTVDEQLVEEPEFAKFLLPLTNRDFIMVRGKKITFLAISESCYRHYPLRHSPEWSEFLITPEEQFIEYFGGSSQTNELIESNINALLQNKWHFVNPLTIVFPSIFTASSDAPEYNIRRSAVEAVASLVMRNEKRRYERMLEMNKPKEIFLSHKSVDKPLVREVANTLTAIGLSPWLDEDKMKAGASLERALRKGLEDSCAAVFFITPRFRDENYLATEIDYALAEKREKGDRFALITLMLTDEDGVAGEVPKILRSFVWKQVKDVEVIRSIVEALPIRLENVVWR